MAATNKALQAKLERLQLQEQIAAIDQDRKFIDELPRIVEAIYTGQGTVVDRTEYLRDDPRFGTINDQISRPSDHENGDNYPHWRTETELSEIRGICRYLANMSETAIGIRDARRNHIVGNGFEISVRPRGAYKDDQLAKEIATKLTGWMESQLEKNRWLGEYEFESFNTFMEDGELLWLVEYDRQDGDYVSFRYEQPDFLTEPNSHAIASQEMGLPADTNWRYGIASPHLRSDKHLGYFVLPYGADQGSVYKPGFVEHMRGNVRRYVKRGVSDYYPVWRSLHDMEKLFGNTVRGATVQAAIAYIREHAAGATHDQIKTFVAGRADATVQTQTPNGSRSTNMRRAQAGTVVDIVAGARYHAGPMGASQSPIYLEVIQQALRLVGVRWQMPEYMISGDASNANYASTLVAESPFVKSCESQQYYLCQSYQRLFRKVIGMGCKVGLIEYPASVVDRLCTVNVEGPAVASRNEAEAHEIRKSQHALGYMSLETMATQEGLDIEEERAKGAAPQQEQAPTARPTAPVYEAWLGYP